ncbi:MAG: GerMN domain-containing protein [Clostridia bacterium]|nr:GerMN domain-containing protein [Clostridia bacterium]
MSISTRKRLRCLCCVLLCTLLLSGCTAAPAMLPVSVPTLPPAAPAPSAPLDDTGLRKSAITPLYLPSMDGQNLLTFYETLPIAGTLHPAESILYAHMAHEGNSRVRPLGGTTTLDLSGADPVEISGSVCTVNLSATALQLSNQDLYTAALAIAATVCELDGIDYVNLLVAGTPVAMDVGGNLPLGSLTAQPGQELPVLWEQMSSRRTPVGQLPINTPLTTTATLYFPLADGMGIAAEPRRISFPGQHPQQQVVALIAALSSGAETLRDVCDMPDLSSLLLFTPEVTELPSGGRRATVHFTADVQSRIAEAGCDPACVFASLTMTLTTFVPSLQQVSILVGDDALTSVYSAQLGSMLFPAALHTRSAYTHLLMDQTTVYVPAASGLHTRTLALPYRDVCSPRAVLLAMAQPAIGALPQGLTNADLLGMSIEGDTLLVNFSEAYAEIIRQSPMDQRLVAYSMVNTLCEMTHARRVRFFFGSEAIESLGTELVWSGEFLYRPGLIIP